MRNVNYPASITVKYSYDTNEDMNLYNTEVGCPDQLKRYLDEEDRTQPFIIHVITYITSDSNLSHFSEPSLTSSHTYTSFETSYDDMVIFKELIELRIMDISSIPKYSISVSLYAITDIPSFEVLLRALINKKIEERAVLAKAK